MVKEEEEKINKVSKDEKKVEEKRVEVKTEGIDTLYIKFSNYFFYGLSRKLMDQGYFTSLKGNLMAAGIGVLSTSYLSVIFMSSLLALIFSIIGAVLLSILGGADIVIMFRNISVSFIIAIAVFAAMFFYPGLEKKSVGSKIDEELPFVALHMSAIAGSGLSPSKIFEILVSDKESPNVAREFKKVVNQINLYGYDIITALKNTAKETASKRLSELLGGMAVTLSEGGELSDFLKKRSETLFFDYKLKRESYTKLAETFMNIYISIVITAPMIFSLLILLMGVSGFGLGLSTTVLTLILILGIGLINIVFLIVLHLKQPSY